jgi:hypothetical protein
MSKEDFIRLKGKIAKPDRNVSQEYQIFGCELAEKLGDIKHKALYIKMAKEKPREILMQALQFVLDYPNAQSKGKLFMYKVKQIETGE